MRAQHKRAVETSGVRILLWAAFLQQSIIPDSLVPECIGIPAATLPPTAMMSIRFVNLLSINSSTI